MIKRWWYIADGGMHPIWFVGLLVTFILFATAYFLA